MRKTTFALLAAGLIVVTGCSQVTPDPVVTSASSEQQPPKTHTPVPEPTATSTRTATSSVTTPAASMTFDCLVEDDFSTYMSMEYALEVEASCDGVFTEGAQAPLIEEWEEKTGLSLTAEDLELYLGICASSVDYPWDFEDFSSAQVEEVVTSLKFCPKHPKAKQVKTALKKSDENTQLEEENRRVSGGSYFVPEEAAAGTWVSENPVEDCYWEVTSASGNIIANNFVTKARQIEFSVKEGQSFTVEGCGIVVNK